VLAPKNGFLVGVDLVKDKTRLHAAYNDSAKMTAEFNRNILRVLNDSLGADFDPWDFDHRAYDNPKRQWIEMRLRARRALVARIPAAGVTLQLQAGDEIRTELSCKYTRETFAARLGGIGLELERWITDLQGFFASVLLRWR
jgi:L-histidine N-alpha-methyltransferase